MAVPAPLFTLAHRLRVPGLILALVALVAGARWATIHRFGSDLPNADQWDAEALQTLLPWFERDHFVAHLVQPHNEHRLVLTKLQALASTLIAGQWDARLEAVANALLATLFLAAFWLKVRRSLAPRTDLALTLLVAALFGVPVAWENILGGFHSQQWWLIGLSALAILHWPFAAPWSGRWLIGAASALLALGAMGSGFLAAAVVAVVAADRWRRRDITARDAAPTLVFALAIVGFGLALRVEFPPHEPLRAKSVSEFLTHLLRSLQWPWRGQIWAGVLFWLPCVLVLLKTFRRPLQPGPGGAQVITALGVWTGLQLLATAYFRGAGADYPAPRYVDTLAFGLLVNACALAWLIAPSRSAAEPRMDPSRAGMVVLATAWVVSLMLGLGLATRRVLDAELPVTRTFLRAAEGNLRGYLASNDPGELASEDIPFPSAEGLVWRLSRPALRDLMPVSVRAPLPLQAGDSSRTVFLPNLVPHRDLPAGSRHGLSPATPPYGGHPTWGSYATDGGPEKRSWMSAPMTAAGNGWLKFEIAGQLGEPGLALELHDAQTGNLIGNVRPSRIPGDGWRAAYVRAPRRPFVVVARDEDPNRWFAFSAPVEMSAGSRLAQLLARNGFLFAVLGAAMGITPSVVLAFAPKPRVS